MPGKLNYLASLPSTDQGKVPMEFEGSMGEKYLSMAITADEEQAIPNGLRNQRNYQIQSDNLLNTMWPACPGRSRDSLRDNCKE